jgi:hypothetical protein
MAVHCYQYQEDSRDREDRKVGALKERTPSSFLASSRAAGSLIPQICARHRDRAASLDPSAFDLPSRSFADLPDRPAWIIPRFAPPPRLPTQSSPDPVRPQSHTNRLCHNHPTRDPKSPSPDKHRTSQWPADALTSLLTKARPSPYA